MPSSQGLGVGLELWSQFGVRIGYGSEVGLILGELNGQG